MKLSVVVPCFNEEESLVELHRRVAGACTEAVGSSYELILVNDGSSDGTWKKMNQLALQSPNVVAVNLSRNHGHQLALTAGLTLTRGDRVFIIDADLQDPPELLHEMMTTMDDGADVVYGVRVSREGESVFKKSTAYLFYRLLDKLVDIKIPKDTGDFRLMSRRAVDLLNSMPEHHRFIRGMVSWVGLNQVAFYYERAARFAGDTKYPLKKMLRLAVDAITGFSVKPLRIASYAGFVLGLTGMAFLVYIVVNYFTEQTVQGWTSLAAISLITASIQLIVLGVMSMYLGRIYVESKNRPLFVIDKVVVNSEELTRNMSAMSDTGES